MKILNDLTGLFDFRISIQYIKNMIKKVLNFIKENNMLQNGDSVVLGVSGGADSICMLYVLKEISKFKTCSGSCTSSYQRQRSRWRYGIC